MRLEQEGLLERVSSGGFVVRTFSIEDVYDAIELRGVMEGTAARLAAERGVEPAKMRQITKIADAIDETLKPNPMEMDFESYIELNSQFHRLLAGLSASETLRREVERTCHLPFASPSAFLDAQADVLEFRATLTIAQQQHRDIIDSIQLRQGSRAEATAREHAQLARRNLEHAMYKDRSLIKTIPGLALVST